MKIKEIFSVLSRKNDERKSVNETVSVSGESMTQKEDDFMEKEVEKTEENVEKTKKPEEKVEEQPKEENVEKTEEKVEETTEDKGENELNEVQTTEPSGNGIRVEDVATKDFVKEMLEGFSAKLDAVLKENQDLKDKLAESNGKVTEMQEKYENKDFGGFTDKGVKTKDKIANDTFEEYSKQFM